MLKIWSSQFAARPSRIIPTYIIHTNWEQLHMTYCLSFWSFWFKLSLQGVDFVIFMECYISTFRAACLIAKDTAFNPLRYDRSSVSHHNITATQICSVFTQLADLALLWHPQFSWTPLILHSVGGEIVKEQRPFLRKRKRHAKVVKRIALFNQSWRH